MTVSSVGLRTTYNTAEYSDTDCGCRRQAIPSLGFCFPHRKEFHTYSFGCSGFMLAVFCHRLTATSRIHVCQIWLHVYNGKTSEAARLFSSPSFDYHTWRKGSLPGSWRHTRTLAIVVRPRPSKSVPFFSRKTCVTLRSTVTGCRQTQVLRVLSDLSLSDSLALWKQKSALWREGVSSRKDFCWYEAFLPVRGRENQERSAWLEAADYADWRSCPAGPSRKGNPPRLRPFCE